MHSSDVAWVKRYWTPAHSDAVERRERMRHAWLLGAPDHPQGISGEGRDMIPAILDQGYNLPRVPADEAREAWLGYWE